MSDMHRPILPKEAGVPASTIPNPAEPQNPTDVPAKFDAGAWLKRFFAANPFYLASVVALLYGIYRVSLGAGFLRIEAHQLLFNFTALQVYEIALVGLAVLLARRLVWYDSTLLVLIENLVLIVPFILVTQASLIDQHWIWGFCAAGVGLAAARIGSLKKFLRELNFPWRMAALGGVLLLANAVLPVVYRELQEDRVAKNPTWGAAYWMNQWSWLVILPMLVASASLLPKPKSKGPLWPQKRWLPFSLFSLWIVATGVHLYALSYVYTFQLYAAHWAPVWLVLGWTLFNRLTDFMEYPPRWVETILLVACFPAPFLAFVSNNTPVAVILLALNTALYAWTGFRREHPGLALHLAMASGVSMLACVSVPLSLPSLQTVHFDFSFGQALIIYLLLTSLISQRPEMGLLGGITAGVALGQLIPALPIALNCAVHGGLMFLLLHSLLWKSDVEPAARALRWVAGGLWIVHAWIWAAAGGPAGQLILAGIVTMALWAVAFKLRGERPPIAVAMAGAGVTFAGPVVHGFDWLISAPAGLVAMVASFALLGAGTVAALTKHRWHSISED